MSDLTPSRQKLGIWPQVALIFFTVSGGAYGLEALVGAVGPLWTIGLTCLVPIFWAAPIALMSAELASAIPIEGGYYIWVKRALGPFWAFQEGWWTLCYSVVDLALYPVLFVNYLAFFFPEIALPTPYWQTVRWLVCLTFILGALFFNLRGTKVLGINAVANLFVVSFPFMILTVFGAYRGSWQRLASVFTQTAPQDAMRSVSKGEMFAKLAAGLAIILWNYSGWDNTSTYAEEVENPQRNYPRALTFALIIIVLSYLFPLLAGFKATLDLADWSETAGWPTVAEKLGGHWLGVSGALAALLSVWSLFNGQLLYLSRLPVAMARDNWLPGGFSKFSKNGSPTVVLVVLALAAALFSVLSLNKLMVVDILFYTLGLALEFAALVKLRKIDPTLARPFRLPLNSFGLFLLAIPPLLLGVGVAVFSIMGLDRSYAQLEIVLGGIVSGLLYYWLRKKQIVVRS